MTQRDWHIKAVAYWRKANADLKIFSEACYHVDNKQALADDCSCNVRTIQLYAAAWSLYQEMLAEYGDETVSLLWERGAVALWRKAPQLRSKLNLSLEQTGDYLENAIEEHMSSETFAAHVDEKENDTPKWIRRLQSVISRLAPIRNDWRAEMPMDVRNEFDAALSAFVAVLEKITREKA